MSRPQALRRTLGAVALALCVLSAEPALANEKLVVYSARIEALVESPIRSVSVGTRRDQIIGL